MSATKLGISFEEARAADAPPPFSLINLNDLNDLRETDLRFRHFGFLRAVLDVIAHIQSALSQPGEVLGQRLEITQANIWSLRWSSQAYENETLAKTNRPALFGLIMLVAGGAVSSALSWGGKGALVVLARAIGAP